MRAARLPLLALAVAAGTAAPRLAGAGAGSIRGRVEVTREPPAPAARPSIGELSMPSPRDLPNRRRSVVYLEAAPQGAFEEHEGRAVMDQRHEAFVPYVLAVTVGTTVDFTNSDRTYHNVFSLSKPRRFDLGRYATGQSKSVRFDRPGVVRVFCEIHSHMSAFILVFAHRFFATTDAEGRYRIDNVPPGAYTIVAWNDGEARETRTMRVPEDGGVLEQDFVVR
ncbi:MAG TPA: carboxypeptidase regulatory-like domain-containing protein [Vicinamibacteria bacterium]|jgi:plastocyanin|nr:carboxypeptidase regulatory-like domain-containing protein [Vicinamibacteria bacterium]